MGERRGVSLFDDWMSRVRQDRIEQRDVDALFDERTAQRRNHAQLDEHGIGHDQHAAEAEAPDHAAEPQRSIRPDEDHRTRLRHELDDRLHERFQEPVAQHPQFEHHRVVPASDRRLRPSRLTAQGS